MGLPLKWSHVPPRVATGAFILQQGLSKRKGDEATAESLHGMAKSTYPFLDKVPAGQFLRLLSVSEIALGGVLLLPLIPTAVAGAGLTGFSAGLLGLYLRTPGMRKEGSLAPTPEGLGIAKDVWMLGIGLGMLMDGLSSDDQG